MRYRKLDASGDYTLGGASAFLVNSPEAVAQAVSTPWLTEILGKIQQGRNPDAAIKQRILGTQGVTEITDYTSTFDGTTRKLSVTATINTIYGAATISETL